MSVDWATFDAGLDAYQARLVDEAEEARERSYHMAARPGSVPAEVAYSDLMPGDYMTNEGPNGRWVKVLEIRGPSFYVRSKHQAVKDGMVSVLFQIPEPVTVSGETRYWVERPEDELVLIDMRCRAGKLQGQAQP